MKMNGRQRDFVNLTTVENFATFTPYVHKVYTVGISRKNPRTNKLGSIMLKSKNQVNLFINDSYI